MIWVIVNVFLFLVAWIVLLSFGLFIYDRFIQKSNIVIGRFPVLGRMRYVFHELRPFFRQYFGDDNAFTPRVIIDWILDVSKWKSWYFAFDKFDTTRELHDGSHQMIHSPAPLNADEMKPVYPTLWENRRKHPLQFRSYFYRSAMSLGSIGFEATSAMAAACVDSGAPFNTWEGGFSVHHIPRVKFTRDRKFFKSIPIKFYLVIFSSFSKPIETRSYLEYHLTKLWSKCSRLWKVF